MVARFTHEGGSLRSRRLIPIVCFPCRPRELIRSEVVGVVVKTILRAHPWEVDSFLRGRCMREHREPIIDYLSQLCANPLHISKKCSTFAALTS